MIFHVSIDADEPRRVAEVIAELWGGVAMPFPPVTEGSWVAFAGDERSSLIEVYPRGTDLVPGDGDADATGRQGARDRRTATHIAIGTTLTSGEVMTLAAAEGWETKYRRRGGAFGVIELWIENRVLIEVLTQPMQNEYLGAVTIDGWQTMLQSGQYGGRPLVTA